MPLATLTLADDLTVTRMGYGAMQLAGPGVFGPPKDRAGCIAVLRKAVELGVTHIDTSDFYGPFVVNEIIKEALHPYPADLRIVTKVGAVRGEDGSWNPDQSREGLTAAVHSNLKNLGVEALDVVNLRVGHPLAVADEPITEPFAVLADLQKQGLIRHLGVSNVTSDQLTDVQSIAPVVTVQNLYNIANRNDDDLVDRCAREGIGFTPFFPLGGGISPLQSKILDQAAEQLNATTRQIALAWLLHRSPTMLLIPGTASIDHLHENMAAASLELPADALEDLNAIGK